MAKGMYAAIGSTTKKIKKNYAVVDGKTRKIKKMYAVVNGVTRLIFSGSGMEIITSTSVLSFKHDIRNASSASTTDYATFQYDTILDAYNKSLTKTVKTLTSIYFNRAACSFNGNALYYGGKSSSNTYVTTNQLSIINNSLTETNNHYLGHTCSRSGGATVGNVAIFGGGYYYEYEDGSYNGTSRSEATMINTSYTKTNLYLNYSDCDMHTASLNSYAIFTGSYSKTTTPFNSSGTRFSSVQKSYSYSTNSCMASVDGQHALLVVGSNSSSYHMLPTTNLVDVWNNSLTKSTTTTHISKSNPCGISMGKYAVFKGGYDTNSSVLSEIELFDSSLTRTLITESTNVSANAIGTCLGNLVFIGGGRVARAGACTDTLEVINFDF